jgi:hypothetical protein
MVLKVLNWKIQYPNMAFWANYVSKKWDDFSLLFNSRERFQIGVSGNLNLPGFRIIHELDYDYFRFYFQIIDVMSLDFESLRYPEHILCASVIYLLTGLRLKNFDLRTVTSVISKDPSVISDFYDLMIIFERFLEYLNCKFDDLVNHVSYVATFFSLPINNALPQINPSHSYHEGPIAKEDFYQYQTVNENNVEYMNYLMSLRNPDTISKGNN